MTLKYNDDDENITAVPGARRAHLKVLMHWAVPLAVCCYWTGLYYCCCCCRCNVGRRSDHVAISRCSSSVRFNPFPSVCQLLSVRLSVFICRGLPLAVVMHARGTAVSEKKPRRRFCRKRYSIGRFPIDTAALINCCILCKCGWLSAAGEIIRLIACVCV